MSSDRFWLRKGPVVPFRGLKQGSEPNCVYASVAGAMNHVAGKDHWSVDALVAAYIAGGHTSRTFDTVVPIAAEPVKGLVSYEIARERLKKGTPSTFVAELSQWVKDGGVAVISLEAADGPLPAGKRLQAYHMLTLIAKEGDRFQVWDTNEMASFVTEAELETGFKYLPIAVHHDPWMIKHPEHDCVLFRKPRGQS